MSKKKTEEINEETKEAKEKVKEEAKTEEKKEIVYQAAPDPTMTFYTAFAILAALVSVAATAFSTIFAVDPATRAANTVIGKFEVLSDPVSMQWFVDDMMADKNAKIFRILVIIAAVCVLITALVSLYVAIRSINPEKKPLMLLGLVSFAFALAAILLFVFAHHFITLALDDARAAYETIYKDIDFSNTGIFDVIYYGNLIASGANVLFAGVNVFAILYGYNRFMRDGRAF